MKLKRTQYSVLIISSADSFADALGAVLSPADHQPVVRVASISAAKRLLAERQFDFVMINAPVQDEAGIEFACDLASKSASAIVVFVRADAFAAAYEQLTPFGVFTMHKPLAQHAAMTALLWLAAARERNRQHESKAVSLAQKMQDIRTVNKAKWFLIEHEHMNEAQAHRHIEKQAMDRCVSRTQIAEEIIKKYT